jgi:hypothetical protein
MEGVVIVKLVGAETKSAIPDVLVAAYCRQPATSDLPQRLGSGITDAYGMVEISYHIDEPISQPLYIGVIVTAAEGPDPAAAPLYQTSEKAERSNPGASETFLVRLPEDALRGQDVEIPEAEVEQPANARTVIHRVRTAYSQQSIIESASRSLASEHVSHARTEMLELESSIRAQLRTPLHREEDGPVVEAAYLIGEQDSVAAATRQIIEQGLTRHFRDATRTGLLHLPPADAERISSLSAADVDALLFGDRIGEGTALSLVRDDPLLVACRDHRSPACADAAPDANGDADPLDEPPESGGSGGPGTPEETEHEAILRRVRELIGSTSGPGTGAPVGRPGVEQIAHSIAAFRLRSSPADTTAVFDFDTLHIAFEHVWREAFDEDVIDTAMELYNEIVLLGGEPPRQRLPDATYLRALRAEVRALSRVVPPRPASGRAALRHSPVQAEPLVRDHRNGSVPVSAPRRPPGRGDGPPPVRGPRTRPGPGDGPPPVRDHRNDPVVRDHRSPAALMRELEERLREPYRFTTYAVQDGEHSVNFGLIVTYRQHWQPIEYQVGELVKTATLAPREEITYTRRETGRRTRQDVSRRAIDQIEQREETGTTQDIVDIVRAARSGMGLDVGTYKAMSGGVQSSAEKTSSETKRRIREAVRKSAQEVKESRSVEVSVGEERTVAMEQSGKLLNPNDELPVTYLFYELQRRYQVSEKIHRLTPVVLVAQPVPAPHEITPAWIVQHDWILERGILDPSFLPALDYLRTSSEGAALELKELRDNLTIQRRLIEELKGELRRRSAETGNRYAALAAAVERSRAAVAEANTEGYIEKGVELLFGSKDIDPDAARLVEEASRDAYERALQEERDLRERLQREDEALARATERYIEALREHKDRELAILRLRVHIKQNILHYMRLIWDAEDPDQRFFRLHQVRVPRIEGDLEYAVSPDPDVAPLPPHWTQPVRVRATARIDAIDRDVTLAEIADLDHPLGYKGNYLIVPLREANVLTKLMMVPYADAAAGLRDPDEPGNYSRADLDRYVCCLRKHLSEGQLEELLPAINAAYQRLLSAPHPDQEEIVVPTGSLYIEALPGAHAIIEDFKLQHRALDMLTAASELRRKELENLRYAARIVEGELGDPEVDKFVRVDGASSIMVGD